MRASEIQMAIFAHLLGIKRMSDIFWIMGFCINTHFVIWASHTNIQYQPLAESVARVPPFVLW